MEEVSIVVRWAHLLLGITWIGMLYYFNFVQGGYFKKDCLQGKRIPYSGLVPNTLRWFRWVAALIFAIAVYLLWQVNSLFNDFMLISAIMSACMLINVCFIIWPAQQISLGFKKGDRSSAAERAILASRTNGLFCLPVSYCIFASMQKGYMPEHMLFGVNSSGVDMSLSVALFVVVALELNVVIGGQVLKASTHVVAQSSMGLAGILFFSLIYM